MADNPRVFPDQVDPQGIISLLERHDRIVAAPAPTPFWGRLNAVNLLRIVGLRARFEGGDRVLHNAAQSILVAAYGAMSQVLCLVLCTNDKVGLYYGLPENADKALPLALLSGLLPEPEIADVSTVRIGSVLQSLGLMAYQGRVYGIPTLPSEEEGSAEEGPWDKVLKGLAGQPWGCVIEATPAPCTWIVQQMIGATEISQALSERAHQQKQITARMTAQVEGSIEEYALHLMQSLHHRLDCGQRLGLWHTSAIFFARSEPVVRSLRSLLLGSFAGDRSIPEPFRAAVCSPSTGHPAQNQETFLTSPELARLLQPPSFEYPGYSVRQPGLFLVDRETSKQPPGIVVGQIHHPARMAGHPYTLAINEITKHLFVAGATGSGKTNTCFNLLENIWSYGQGAPFLVIEPAKSEYRGLLGLRNASGTELFPRLGVFTLGNERIAPFRLNPFEFEIVPGANEGRVQRHIDLLKSVFNASFILYAPMPYVLERCLHEIYTDKGWDLATGRNLRVPVPKGGLPPEVFPTLTDLYYKIDPVVDSLGYDSRIQADVKASLKTRINSLRIGAKGLMLDSRKSVPIAKLLDCPVILELDHIGDDEEKAFVIGLLLARIYEYRALEAQMGQPLPNTGLRHVTVIEEAHRLLAHSGGKIDLEAASTKANAVETFANILAEIRSYGEGVIVAEQIPSKVTRDVVKNTNTKILHRLVDREDRDLVGDAMNLNDEQKHRIATLDPYRGEAAIFGGRDEGPYLLTIQVHPCKGGQRSVDDAQVQGAMAKFCSSSLYHPFDSCGAHCPEIKGTQRCAYHLRDEAAQLAGLRGIRQAYEAWMLGALLDAEAFVAGYGQFLHRIRGGMVRQRDDLALIVCLITQLGWQIADNKMQMYGWLIPVIQAMRSDWLECAVGLAKGQQGGATGQAQRTTDHTDVLSRLGQGYRQQCYREVGPFAGCECCTNKCLFRYEAGQIADDARWQARFRAAIKSTPQEDVLWKTCAAAAKVAVTANPQVILGVILCIATQLLHKTALLPENQLRIARLVAGLQKI